MAHTRLQVIATETLKSKAGNQYQVLKCILHGVKLDVGSMRVYGDLAKTEIPVGDYFADFDIEVGFGDRAGEIVPRLVSLTPVRAAKPAA